MTVGERIRERRQSLKLTQEELGKKLGWGRSAVCRVEKGGNNITTDRIVKISKALSCSPSYLMGWTEEPAQFSIFDMGDGEYLISDERGYPIGVKDEPTHYEPQPEPVYEVTADEYELIQKYRLLSDEWKTVVNTSIESGYSDFKIKQQKELSQQPTLPPWEVFNPPFKHSNKGESS